ncbi:nucleoside kinase [candidate division WOR-3 bacterium]|nr:nucleoside kinase [candidate division WOR-3 bacterium]
MAQAQTVHTDELDRLNEWRRYQSTLSLVLWGAVEELLPGKRLRIDHSMSKGFYCTVEERLDAAAVRKIEARMKELIAADHPIQQADFPIKKAINLFENLNQPDKVSLLRNIRKQRVTIYSLEDHYDMYMVPPFDSAGQAPRFRLGNFPPGFILIFPLWQDLSTLPEFTPQPRLARIFSEYMDWVRILGIGDVGPLNHAIKTGSGPQIMKIVEALHEKKIANIADRIVKSKRKVILIAGPSSAGKTTFTKRLAIQLIVNGLMPLVISTDDYFHPHSKTPRDALGRLDFEAIEGVDIALLNDHILKILKGQEIQVPKFNFHTGRRLKGNKTGTRQHHVTLLEGIHCLNDALTPRVPGDLKFKIYVSALTQLNVDDHNRISTTDTRMIRRLVRDTHFRGYRVEKVLRLWGRVRSGEEKNIYPFQEEADEMFNSALIYEPAVLKRYCVPIIKRVKKGTPEHAEANRILDFLQLFNDLEDRDVPSNSILREFIGGSSFLY